MINAARAQNKVSVLELSGLISTINQALGGQLSEIRKHVDANNAQQSEALNLLRTILTIVAADGSPGASADGPSRYTKGVDPLDFLRTKDFAFNGDSFFTAIRIGRIDLVAAYLDAGMSPFTERADPEQSISGTGLALAIFWKSPNFCQIAQLFKAKGVDLASTQAHGRSGVQTLIDDALGAPDFQALECLRRNATGPWDKYIGILNARVRMLREFAALPDWNETLRDHLSDCASRLLESFEPRSEIYPYSDTDYGEIFCVFRSVPWIVSTYVGSQTEDVTSLRQKIPNSIQDDQKMISILAGGY